MDIFSAYQELKEYVNRVTIATCTAVNSRALVTTPLQAVIALMNTMLGMQYTQAILKW